MIFNVKYVNYHIIMLIIQTYSPSQPFLLVHCDIYGPSHVTNASTTKWFLAFIDNHAYVYWFYLLKEKSKTSSVPNLP